MSSGTLCIHSQVGRLDELSSEPAPTERDALVTYEERKLRTEENTFAAYRGVYHLSK